MRFPRPRCSYVLWTSWLLGLYLSCAALVSPVQAESRQARIGILALRPETLKLPYISVLLPTLAGLGWKEGQNLQVEYRFAQSGELDYRQSAADLVARKVEVVLALAAPAGRAMATATSEIPIVIQDYTTDPVAVGYAMSYQRPGKNITGVFLDAPEISGKWLQMLRDIVPGLKRLAVIWDPAPGTGHLEAIRRIAKVLGIRVEVAQVRSAGELETAISSLRSKPEALVILPSPMTYTYADRLAKLTLKHRLLATHMAKHFAQEGGAISYGPDNTESTLRNAAQIAKILNGTPPGSLPIERPFKYDFFINTKTMRALGLKVPDHLLVGAELVQ